MVRNTNSTLICHPAAGPIIHVDRLFQACFPLFSTVCLELNAINSSDQQLSMFLSRDLNCFVHINSVITIRTRNIFNFLIVRVHNMALELRCRDTSSKFEDPFTIFWILFLTLWTLTVNILNSKLLRTFHVPREMFSLNSRLNRLCFSYQLLRNERADRRTLSAMRKTARYWTGRIAKRYWLLSSLLVLLVGKNRTGHGWRASELQ